MGDSHNSISSYWIPLSPSWARDTTHYRFSPSQVPRSKLSLLLTSLPQNGRKTRCCLLSAEKKLPG